MQPLIGNLPEIENLKRLLFEDNPTKQDMVSLKELITKYPDIKIQDDPENESYLTPMGYLIFRDKLDILIESFPTELEASQKLSELKAIVFPTLYHTAIGYALRHGSLSIFSKLAGDKKLSDILTTVFEKGSLEGHNLMAIGTAIRFNNLNDKLLELFSKKLKYGEKLSEVTAFVTPDKKYKTALEYSIDSVKIDSVRLLIKRDPSFVDLKFEKLYLSAASAARFHYSALTHTKISYNQIKEAIAKKTKEGETSDELIAIREKYMSIIKILLENGARFEEDREQYGLPIEITNEIKKIIETKKFYDGSEDLIEKICECSTASEIDEKINIEHLKFLFKQSGIPEHLTAIAQDPKNLPSEISKIIKEIATPEEEFLKDLDLTLGILNNAIDKVNFPVSIGYNSLVTRDPVWGSKLVESEETKRELYNQQKTIASYISNPSLQPNLFLEKNSELEIEVMFLLAGEAKEMFLENSKKCILPKAMHQKIKNIKQKLLSVDPALDMALSLIKNKLESQNAKTQEELTETKQKVEILEQRLARLELIISQQKKEEPSQEQAPTRTINYSEEITPDREDKVAEKRPINDQPSSITQSSDETTKVLKAKTPERSPD
jgi:hypothetical protein